MRPRWKHVLQEVSRDSGVLDDNGAVDNEYDWRQLATTSSHVSILLRKRYRLSFSILPRFSKAMLQTCEGRGGVVVWCPIPNHMLWKLGGCGVHSPHH